MATVRNQRLQLLLLWTVNSLRGLVAACWHLGLHTPCYLFAVQHCLACRLKVLIHDLQVLQKPVHSPKVLTHRIDGILAEAVVYHCLCLRSQCCLVAGHICWALVLQTVVSTANSEAELRS